MDVETNSNTLSLPNGDVVKKPFLIGVAGGTASGKSTVCKKIMTELGQTDMEHDQRQVVTISQDSFYRELTAAEKAKAFQGLYNFDHPDAFNEQLMYETLQAILKGIKVEIPTYDYRTNSLDYENKLTIYPADVVLFEGILVFYFPKIRDLFHMKLFVDTDSDTRLARRVPRDINERGRDLDAVLTQYMTFVKPAFEEFCSPTKKFADVIIPRGADNTVAIDLIVHHIGEILRPGSSANITGANVANNTHPSTATVSKSTSTTTNTTPIIAIDLIVQHIRDFLNNRSCHGSTSNIQMFMNLDTLNTGGKTSSGIAIANITTIPTNSPIISNNATNVNLGSFSRPH